MDIPNKWRGINKLTHKYVYGELVQFSFAVMIRNDEGALYPVKKDTLQKLAGYDKDGNEVYRSIRNGS